MDDWQLTPARDLGLSPLARLRDARRDPGPASAGCHWLWAAAVRAYLTTAHRLAVEGREHLPSGPPFVLCGNHASHLDALAVAAPLPLGCRPGVFALAAADVFFASPVPTVFAAAVLNALPVGRRSATPRALAELRAKLVGMPCGFVLFPEGGRSRDGAMRAFKPGVGVLVAGTGVPVVPCHLTGTFAALPPGRRLPRPVRVGVKYGPPLTFADVPDDRAGWEAVAARVEAAVRALVPHRTGPLG